MAWPHQKQALAAHWIRSANGPGRGKTAATSSGRGGVVRLTFKAAMLPAASDMARTDGRLWHIGGRGDGQYRVRPKTERTSATGW